MFKIGTLTAFFITKSGYEGLVSLSEDYLKCQNDFGFFRMAQYTTVLDEKTFHLSRDRHSEVGHRF